ncbi:MAG: DNA alkylation repair protein [Candidatus Omnitrophica bacterium]|nr:DNA alkylation repair protein [Candidatus Omnitrophota bacterium]
MPIYKIKEELRKNSNKEKARILQGFFKTAPGEYGYGDVFIGVCVPHIRKIAKKYKEISLNSIRKLLTSRIHEERLIALIILVLKFDEADTADRKKIYELYLKNTEYINNWDLVDLTAPNIVGKFLANADKKILYNLAKSKSLWERRISIVSTFNFIRNNSFSDTIKIARLLLADKEDLIHKACGWMLREVAKRDKTLVDDFLSEHHKDMPRVMLRYTIERFPEKERKDYLKSKIVHIL